MKKSILILIACCYLTPLGSCADEYGTNHLKLYQSIQNTYRPEDKPNIVSSPLIFDIGMSVLKLSAKNTCKRLMKINGLTTNNVKMIEGIKGISNSNGPKVTIAISNSLYVSKKSKLRAPIKNQLKKYQTVVTTVDFENNAEGVARKINQKISNDTRGLIKDAVEPGTITSDTQAVIIDTLYFKANWTEPFSSHVTRPFGIDNTPVTMLSGNGKYSIYEETGKRLIVKDYESTNSNDPQDKFVFVISEGPKSLSVKDIQMIKSESIESFTLVLPKIKETTTLDVLSAFPKQTNCLKTKGLTLTEKPSDLSSSIQKIKFETTLAGSKGASVFSNVLNNRFGEEEVVIDKPFTYYVVHLKTGGILFAGRYLKPDITITPNDE